MSTITYNPPLVLLVAVPIIYLYNHGAGRIPAPMVQLPLGNVKLLNIKIELQLHEAFTLLRWGSHALVSMLS